ncbi:MAG TPA: hypothetical protein DEV93_04470 [Chloroflexi bacterium]|nr:hypothetical protein [Chloroflexota bacterium]
MTIPFRPQTMNSFSIRNTKISLVHGDIVELPMLDALVSSDDTSVSMSGGVSRAIREAAGSYVQQEAQRQLPKAAGEVIVTAGGNLNVRHILHALVLDWEHAPAPTAESVYGLTLRCLQEAESLACGTIALPSFGTGAGGINKDVAAHAMLSAICDHLRGQNSSLTSVYVDVLSPSYSTLRPFLVEFIRTELLHDFEERFQSLSDRLLTAEDEKAELEAQISALTKEAADQASEWKYTTRDLPHPLAYAYGLSLTPLNWQARAKACFDAFEAIARCLALVGMAIVTQAKLKTASDWLNESRQPRTFGKWIEVARETAKQVEAMGGSQFMVANPGDFKTSNSRVSQLFALLNQAPSLRNELIHPIVKPEAECRALAEEWTPKLEKALELVKAVIPQPWLVVEGHKFGQGDGYVYTMARITGESVLFRHTSVESALRLPDETVVLWSPKDGAMLRLTPFVVKRMCPLCKVEDTFLLESSDGSNRVEYVSYRAGHKVTVTLSNAPGALS